MIWRRATLSIGAQLENRKGALIPGTLKDEGKRAL
jgi:hypothetical protein